MWFCTSKSRMLISMHLVEYKYAKKRFKYLSPIGRNVSENLCVSVDKPLVVNIPFYGSCYVRYE